MPRTQVDESYPDLSKMSTEELEARLDKFRAKWEKGRRGGMRLDSFSALYIGGEIERMKEALQ